jgi:dihydroxyacetone kinase
MFASPAAGQVYRVTKAANAGGGVLLSYGNYAGDVLHFGQAQLRLNAEGIETRTVLVTDDIASAPLDQIEKRRGIAGDLTVFKIAGAAAEAGLDLDDVERLAIRTNYRTRSLGVAFDGCTLPGAEAPLFSVPAGHMSLGLGIHGEPGISDHPMPNAPNGVNAMIVPSFRSLSAFDRPPNVPALVIPPFPDGNPFDPDTPVPEQLTSTVSGVVQSVRQLFLLLNAPRDVPWLGFR